MPVILRGWSKKFSVSTIYGNNIGKIFFSKLVHEIINFRFMVPYIVMITLNKNAN